jgi:hypothetical protein
MSHVKSEQGIRMAGHDPATGEWNDSLTGDSLWSNVNVSEAVPDVMTPSTWALWQIYYYEASPIQIPGDHRICGNICGRPYINLGLLVSLYRAIGRDIRKELHSDMVGSAPPDLDITPIPFSAFAVIRTTLPGMLQARRHVSRDKRQVPEFVATTPGWCQSVQRQIRETQDKAALVALWRERIRPYFVESCWLLRGAAMLFADPATTLHRDLVRLIGEADANALLSNLAGHAAGLESLGPLIGLAKVARGEMRREAYLERYGHRSPHEMELSSAGPEEDPHWLDRQLDELAASPFSARCGDRYRCGRTAVSRGHRRPRTGHSGCGRLRQRHDAPQDRRPGASGWRARDRCNLVRWVPAALRRPCVRCTYP